MGDTVYNHLESIKKENILYRFKQEQKYCSNDERLIVIENILKQYERKKEDNKMSLKKFHDSIDKINEMIYKNTWTQLQPFQKEDRLIKYIDSKYKDDDEMRDLLLKLFKKGKLNKSIEYDSKNGVIINIDIEMDKK